MNYKKRWSICICHVNNPKRSKSLDLLLSELNRQVRESGFQEDIEILVEADNGELTVGKKRNHLIEKSAGEYICFIDDDDFIHPNYVEEIFEHLNGGTDMVFFQIKHLLNGEYHRTIIPSQHIESTIDSIIFTKNYFHLCPHKTEYAEKVEFLNVNFMEDIDYSQKMSKYLYFYKSIDKHLYIYNDVPSESLTR
jgi:glycosyltransferase involved in cell wall biosynthesis